MHTAATKHSSAFQQELVVWKKIQLTTDFSQKLRREGSKKERRRKKEQSQIFEPQVREKTGRGGRGEGKEREEGTKEGTRVWIEENKEGWKEKMREIKKGEKGTK